MYEKINPFTHDTYTQFKYVGKIFKPDYAYVRYVTWGQLLKDSPRLSKFKKRKKNVFKS